MLTPLEIAKRIQEAGFESYFVGGYVRDSILGVESSDIDIATNAKYHQIIQLFSDAKIDEVGKSFQVMIIDGVEIATYRADIYDDNGNLSHTNVLDTIEEDLSRRDLTINSIAMNPFENNYIDMFNGINDIKKRIIRFTGDVDKRINEDPIRMIRACRFLAMIERSRFAKDTFFAIRKNAKLIDSVPKERIRLEIVKAMKAKNAGNFFRALANTNLLKYIFPEMIDTINHDGGVHHNETIFEHCVMACDDINGIPMLKISAFLHDIGKPIAWLLNSNGSFKGHDKFGSEIAEKALKRLKFSTNEIHYITNMIKLHMVNLTLESTPKSIRRLLVKLNDVNINYEDICKMVIADSNSNMKKGRHTDDTLFDLKKLFESEIEKSYAFSIKDLDINGKDVMSILNIKPGPEVGNILEKLFKKIVDNPDLNNYNDLVLLVKEMIK